MPPTLRELEAWAFDIYDAYRRGFPEGVVCKFTTWETLSPASKDIWVQIAQDVLAQSVKRPVPMILFCPSCHERHVDVEFANKLHHTHACQECGMCWRPAVVPTVGVQFLPGFKDESKPKGWSLNEPCPSGAFCPHEPQCPGTFSGPPR